MKILYTHKLNWKKKIKKNEQKISMFKKSVAKYDKKIKNKENFYK